MQELSATGEITIQIFSLQKSHGNIWLQANLKVFQIKEGYKHGEQGHPHYVGIA